MSKANKKLVNLNKNEFIDRRLEENETFPALTIRLETIDTVLLLLDSQEEVVLISTLKHIMVYSHENISMLKQTNVLLLLLQKEFYRLNSSILVRRLSLSLASFMIDNTNCLVELEATKLNEIVNLCLLYYLEENDDFCCEYLSVILNKCVADPQMVKIVLKDDSFVLKYFSTINTSTNADILLHSMELMHRILLVISGDTKRNFISLTSFPVNRLLTELSSEFFDIRKAALKLLKILVTETSESNPLNRNLAFLLEKVTNMFCGSLLLEELKLLVEVLVAAMEQEFIVSLFFEFNLFDKFLMRIKDENVDPVISCKALWVFTECAKCDKFVPRLVSADLTEAFLECLLDGDNNPEAHVLLGLLRLMKSPQASKCIIDSYDRNLLGIILELLPDTEIDIKTREQAANLLQKLLTHAFHKTANLVLDLKLSGTLAHIFAQDPEERSIDLVISILNVLIEMLTARSDYRTEICSSSALISNMGVLLMNSFSTAILVAHLFRCLSSMVEEEVVHQLLMDAYICSSIKRGLQSLSYQVKTAVTNFIMQTTRFPIFLRAYIELGILEVLILHQKDAYCVPTWAPAIESILSKSPTLKFCIRNNLGFTDITVGNDFMVSKKKFEDFRILQCILKEDVSPLHPVIVVNFNRTETPANLVVKVPVDCNKSDELGPRSDDQEWCYCRSPGDEFLPKYLEEVNRILESRDLAVRPWKMQGNIDFENLEKRAKVIAQVVAAALSTDLNSLDLNTPTENSPSVVKCHLRELCIKFHCSFIPMGHIRSGCKFERAILFKAMADQIGLPCTLQRSVDGHILFNELPVFLEFEQDVHCDNNTMNFMPWRTLRPTHIVDLMYNVGELYLLGSGQALQYLRPY